MNEKEGKESKKKMKPWIKGAIIGGVWGIISFPVLILLGFSGLAPVGSEIYVFLPDLIIDWALNKIGIFEIIFLESAGKFSTFGFVLSILFHIAGWIVMGTFIGGIYGKWLKK